MSLRRSLFIVLPCAFIATAYLHAGGLAPRGAAPAAPTAALSQSAESQATAESQRAVLQRYCFACHSDQLRTGGLSLEAADVADVASAGETWEKVVRKLNAGMMPPPGMPRPDAVTQRGLVSWLEDELDRAALANPDPGRTETFHRLNRTEYKNAIRDLLALDIAVDELLPPDDSSYGFDNNAGVLRLSQSLMERYLFASRKISRWALGIAPPAAVADTFGLSSDQQQYDRGEGLPFGTRGGIMVPYTFPRDGEYIIRAEFSCALVAAAGCDGSANFDDDHQLEVAIDGERVHLFELPSRTGPSGYNERTSVLGDAANTTDLRWQVRVPVLAGVRNVAVAFLRLPSYETSDYPRLRFTSPSYEGNMVPRGLGIYQPHLKSVTILGPFAPAGGAGDTPSRQRVFVCHPESAADEAPCAREILSVLARRAYRRPVTEADVDKLFAFYAEERAQAGSTMESGLEMALRALLVRPEFLFRIEADPTPGIATQVVSSPRVAQAPTAVAPISDLELASRLSFFLWSSIPDDALLDLAAQERLTDPGVLEPQIRRMLADPRSEALAQNFLPQWLNYRTLEVAVPADPDFDESLRAAMLRETELFFDSVLRENRSVHELLTADYTFLNERLAAHYGIKQVKGSHFRRVMLGDSPRRGILGHASILTATSAAVRTSPVKRGKWVLESILGVSPPPPPPVVPDLEEQDKAATRPLSMREKMAAHRENPVCAGCHAMIDPVGFALENFDQTGRWRVVDPSMTPLDVSGSLPDGTTFTNLPEFRAALLSPPERFAGAVTERLLTYALGRGLEYYDMPAVRAITRDAADDGYRLSELIVGIAKSVPFQMRRSQPAAAPAGVARRF